MIKTAKLLFQKISIALLLLWTIPLFESSGQNIFILDKTIPQSGTILTSDDLGNIYIVQQEKLLKYDLSGNLLKTFDDKSYGDIASIDVTDPLKILVFYKDFSKIVFLDNTLSPKGDPISLADKGFSQTLLACTSTQNAFWTFDQESFQLYRFDINISVSNKSESFLQESDAMKPVFMKEYNNFIYLSDTLNGVMVFDRYGTFSKTYILKPLPCFQLIGENLLYIKDQTLHQFNLKSLEENKIILPVADAISANVRQSKLIILTKLGFSIYTSNVNFNE